MAMSRDPCLAVHTRRAQRLARRVSPASALRPERLPPAVVGRQPRGLRGLRLDVHSTYQRHHGPPLVSGLPTPPGRETAMTPTANATNVSEETAA